MLLGWFDSTPKKPLVDKLREGCERYRQKFGGEPHAVLLNEAEGAPERIEELGLDCVVTPYVQRDNYFIGSKEDAAFAARYSKAHV